MINISKKASFFLSDSIISMSSLIILVCLVLSISFPAEPGMQQITKSLSFLVIIPILYIKLILKRNLKDYGLDLSDKKNGTVWAVIMLLISLLIAYFLISYTGFKKNYILPTYVVNNFWFFTTYELILVNILLFVQNFFYQGFALFTYFKKLSHWSIIIQAFLYLAFVIILGNFSWQLAPFIILSFTGGWVAYKSRSFIYAYVMGLLFIIILDSYIIYTIK